MKRKKYFAEVGEEIKCNFLVSGLLANLIIEFLGAQYPAFKISEIL